MITLDAWFWVMIVIFGVIGMLRGWTKEIITAAGLVLSLFALHSGVVARHGHMADRALPFDSFFGLGVIEHFALHSSLPIGIAR